MSARTLLWILFLFFVMGTAACDPSAGAPGSVDGAPESREMAPEFTLARLDGGEIALTELRGKTVVLDFWATWCPPCEFQVPELNAVHEATLSQGRVAVLGVSVDTDGPDVVGKWAEEKDVRYPIVLGDEDLARRYGAMGFPTLVVISPDGAIHSVHTGLIDADELEEILQEIGPS